MVEPVHPHEPVLPLYLLGELVNGERGCVGSQNRVLPACAVQAGEDLLLQLKVLEDGLDH